MDITKLIIV